MHYINTALNPSRLLNHKKHVLRCCKIFETSVQRSEQNDTLKKAGHIELQLTDKCNLACSFCRFRKQGDTHIKFESIFRALRTISPKAITLSGGGEPTCYPQFNEAINCLSTNNTTRIGLITNGVKIPEGSWHKNISWIRISVYSTVRGKYSGRNSLIKEDVINNVKWYIEQTQIPQIGIQFLFYRENIHELSRFTLTFFEIFRKGKVDVKRVYIQFKAGYLSSRPSTLSPELHQDNIEFLPSDEQLKNSLSELEGIKANNSKLSTFLEECSNLDYLYSLKQGGLKRMRNLTNPHTQIEPNFHNCYFCFAHRLITPEGDIYPCATLANHRDESFSICNINDIETVKQLRDKMSTFYMAATEVCNPSFCLYSKHNLTFLDRVYLKDQTIIPNTQDIFL